jgi:hypothetical protein
MNTGFDMAMMYEPLITNYGESCPLCYFAFTTAADRIERPQKPPEQPTLPRRVSVRAHSPQSTLLNIYPGFLLVLIAGESAAVNNDDTT